MSILLVDMRTDVQLNGEIIKITLAVTLIESVRGTFFGRRKALVVVLCGVYSIVSLNLPVERLGTKIAKNFQY